MLLQNLQNQVAPVFLHVVTVKGKGFKPAEENPGEFHGVSSFDTDHLLPTEGMLWFFAPLDYFLGDFDSPLDYHMQPRVIYSRQTKDLKPYDLHWEGTEESVFRPAEKIVFTVAESPCADGLMMLGTPYQDEVRCQHEGDVCLLQIDEDDRWGLRFYDCGMYFIFVPSRDLCRLCLEKATGELFYY